MIYLITNKQLDINYPYVNIKQLNEIEIKPTLIIIDYIKLDFNQISLLSEKYKKMRVIVLSEKYSQKEQISCYKNDVYQYLFDPEILNEHLSHIINRLNKHFKILHSVEFDDNLKKIKSDNLLIVLPKKEYAIFKYLYTNKERVCTQQEILTQVLGYHENIETRLVSVYVRYIRKKLEPTSIDIKTIRMQGYTIVMKES